MNSFPDGLAGSGNGLIVVFYFLALINEWLHCGFTAVIYEYRSDFEDSLRMKVFCRVCDCDISVDISCNSFKDLRFAGNFHIFSQLGHFVH